MRYLGLIFIIFFTSQCKKDLNLKPDLGLDYYPIELNHWLEYQVDSIVYSDFTDPVSISTSSYQIREIIESSYQDLENELNYRIISERREDENSNWNVEGIFSLKPTSTNIQKVENDLKFVKLVFPVKQGTSWNGNIFLNVQDDPILYYYDQEKFDWQYRYTTVNEAMEIGGHSFEDCIIIEQIDEENLFEKKYSTEIYARGVGLVYKELVILETQAPPTEEDFFQRAENGFILRYTISNFKQL